MKKIIQIHLMGILVILASISAGFFNSNNDHSKSIPDPASYGEQFNSTSDNITTGIWTIGAPIGTKSLGGGAATYLRNDTGWLYYIGGDQDFTGNMTARNESYNTVTNTWTVNSSCPTTIEYTGCARLKDTIYIVGGMVTSFFSSETAAVQKYNIRTNTWSTGVPLPQALGGNKAAAYQDSIIFCVGGMNAGGSNAVNNVYVFNSNTNVWRTGTALPSALCLGAFCVYGDSLFYIGGGSSYFSGYVSTVYKGVLSATDKSVITWTTGSGYPGSSRWRFDAAPWGSKGIIVGAGGGNSTFGSSNECYNFYANIWIQLPPMPLAVGSAGVGSVIFSTGIGKFLVVSGEDYPGSPYTVNNCQIYTDTVGPPPPPLNNLCEGFNATQFPPAGWTNTGGIYIYRASVSGFGLGQGSAAFDNWNAPTGPVGDFTTQTFVPSNCPYYADSLFFDIAYCPLAAANDSIIIYTSTNGGVNWSHLFGMGPSYMQTVSSCTHPFVPTNTQWARRGFLIPSGTNKIRFHSYSGHGDVVYLDSICNYGCEGINKNTNVIPNSYSLLQNYPNPFNPTTLIEYTLPKSGYVELKIYGILGKEITVLVSEFEYAGDHSVEFNGNNFASGVYFYRLKVNDFISTKKMLLLK